MFICSSTDSIHCPYLGFCLCLPPWGPAHLHWAQQVGQLAVICNIWLHVSAEYYIHVIFTRLIAAQQRRGCRRCPTSPSWSCTPCTSSQLSSGTWPFTVRPTYVCSVGLTSMYHLSPKLVWIYGHPVMYMVIPVTTTDSISLCALLWCLCVTILLSTTRI